MLNLFLEHIFGAYRSLKMNRVRSFLTMLGVAIGVASVSTILALSDGATNATNSQIEQLDQNLAVATSGTEKEVTTENLLQPAVKDVMPVSNITEDDYLDTKKNLNVDTKLSPLMTMLKTVNGGGNTLSKRTVIATNEDFQYTAGLSLKEDGKFLPSSAKNPSAVVGWRLALDLFGEENPIGKVVTVDGQKFTVLATAEKLSNLVNYTGIEYADSLIVDLSYGKTLNNGHAQIQQIAMLSSNTKNFNSDYQTLSNQLEKNHGEVDFTIKTGSDIATPKNSIYMILTNVMTAIASISLVVGGIGIMNIMLVNVAERTREIGIRKAVGASNASIGLQFFVESVIISLAGGIFGYLAGLISAHGIASLLGFSPVVTLQTTIIALGFSLITGAVFGFYPALRAAQKDPIESLRQYR